MYAGGCIGDVLSECILVLKNLRNNSETEELNAVLIHENNNNNNKTLAFSAGLHRKYKCKNHFFSEPVATWAALQATQLSFPNLSPFSLTWPPYRLSILSCINKNIFTKFLSSQLYFYVQQSRACIWPSLYCMYNILWISTVFLNVCRLKKMCLEWLNTICEKAYVFYKIATFVGIPTKDPT